MAMSPYYVQYLLTQGDLFGRILSFNADFTAKQRTLRQQDPNAITDSLYRLHPQLALLPAVLPLKRKRKKRRKRKKKLSNSLVDSTISSAKLTSGLYHLKFDLIESFLFFKTN